MKRILGFILCVILVFLCSCTEEAHEDRKLLNPGTALVTYSAAKKFDGDMLAVRSIDGEVNESFLSFEAFENLYSKYGGYAVFKVRITGTVSYYTMDENGREGGYTEMLAKVVESYSYSQKALGSYPEGFFSKGSVIRLVELYTVDEKGELRKPTYRPLVTFSTPTEWKQENTNPILVEGREYIVMFNAMPMLNLGYYEINCYIDGEKNVTPYEITEKNLGYWMVRGRAAVNSAFSRFYEFSEEAYEASKAIVEAYEAEGKTMKDGPYYHYRGMVVESWERYSLNADAKEPE